VSGLVALTISPSNSEDSAALSSRRRARPLLPRRKGKEKDEEGGEEGGDEEEEEREEEECRQRGVVWEEGKGGEEGEGVVAPCLLRGDCLSPLPPIVSSPLFLEGIAEESGDGEGALRRLLPLVLVLVLELLVLLVLPVGRRDVNATAPLPPRPIEAPAVLMCLS